MREWLAYCKTCGKTLAEWPNGTMAEAAGRIHMKENPNHEVILGRVLEDYEAMADSIRNLNEKF